MEIDDKILLENYFYIYGDKGHKYYKSYLDLVLNFILNSKEMENSDISISDVDLEAELLSLAIKVLDLEPLTFRFSGLYYVTDGELSENRTMVGTLTLDDGEAILLMNIERYGFKQGVRQYELSETFVHNYEEESYERFSSYSLIDANSIDKIKFNKFDKAQEFKDYSLKLIKSRNS